MAVEILPSTKRALFFATRLRFSPQTQRLRDVTIDKVVEHGLLLADCDAGLTEKELEDSGSLSFNHGCLALTHIDVHSSITRLHKAGRITTVSQRPNRYRLVDTVRVELWSAQSAVEMRFNRVLAKLFAGVDVRPYAQPFHEFLCDVFSQLGETYVRCLKGEGGRDELSRHPNLQRSIDGIITRQQLPNERLFAEACLAFFRDPDVDYDNIKWTFGQNYYTAKVIGYDPSGFQVCQKVFGGSLVYLDTNIIINVLEPLGRHHQSLQMLRKACERLHMDLRVCQVSLDELRAVVQGKRELIAKVANEIPDALASQVRGVFFAMYREQRQQASGEVDLNALFSNFEAPATALRERYGIEIVDDPWFDEASRRGSPVAEFADTITAESKVRRPGHPKHKRPALHDAQLLKWIERDRQTGARNVWLLTLDSLLPALLETPQPDGMTKPVAITLDALLQWISPITIHDATEESQFATIFSEAVKYMLLPQDRVFDLADFEVLADMEMDSKLMPLEDVEAALRTVHAGAARLDLTDPNDREKMAYELARFISSPGRKFKQILAKKEDEREAADREARLARTKLEQQRIDEIGELTRTHEAEMRKLEDAHKSAKDDLQRQLDAMAVQLADVRRTQAEDKRVKRLRRSAYARFGAACAVFVCLMFACTYIALRFGEPQSDFQKLLDADKLFALVFAVWIVSFFFIMGSRERIRALAWPIRRYFSETETNLAVAEKGSAQVARREDMGENG